MRLALTALPAPAVLFAPAALIAPLLLAAAEPPAFVREAGTVRLAPDAESRWIPFELTPGNQIRFALSLDGKPVSAILDTGVSYSVLGRSSPALDRARLQSGGRATAIGGSVAIGWLPTGSIVMGGLTRTGGGVTVTDLPALATGSADPIDMLIGRDMIGGQALDIDYAARRFRLIRSGHMPFVGASAPLGISAERKVYESEIILGGRRLRPMVVDTGDGSAITVTTPGWRSVALPGLATTTAISFGLAGPVVSELAIVPELGLGTLVARQVEVRIEPADGFSQSIGTAGRIGTGFLQKYRVLLDPGAGRMVLSAGPGADQPPLRSTSGLLVGTEKDRLKILHVMRGSPAEATGWKAGELICTIDGQPIPADYARNAMAGWSVAAPGTVVKLGLCDGTQRALTTRRFY